MISFLILFFCILNAVHAAPSNDNTPSTSEPETPTSSPTCDVNTGPESSRSCPQPRCQPLQQGCKYVTRYAMNNDKCCPIPCNVECDDSNNENTPSASPPTRPTTCPSGCTSYFDGCNTCSCNSDGSIGPCTKKSCTQYEAARCTQYEATRASCMSINDPVAWCKGANLTPARTNGLVNEATTTYCFSTKCTKKKDAKTCCEENNSGSGGSSGCIATREHDPVCCRTHDASGQAVAHTWVNPSTAKCAKKAGDPNANCLTFEKGACDTTDTPVSPTCDPLTGPESSGPCPQPRCQPPQQGCKYVTRYAMNNDKCCPIPCNVECDDSNNENTPSASPPTRPTTCPSGCTSYFDGCNTCSCNLDGSIGPCTKKSCTQYEAARCTQHDDSNNDNTPSASPPTHPATCPSGCTSYFDGCNTCSCNFDGSIGQCTKMQCAELKAARCKGGRNGNTPPASCDRFKCEDVLLPGTWYNNGRKCSTSDESSCDQETCCTKYNNYCPSNCPVGQYRSECHEVQSLPGHCVACTNPIPSSDSYISDGGLTNSCPFSSSTTCDQAAQDVCARHYKLKCMSGSNKCGECMEGYNPVGDECHPQMTYCDDSGCCTSTDSSNYNYCKEKHPTAKECPPPAGTSCGNGSGDSKAPPCSHSCTSSPFDCSDLLQNYLNPGGCAEQCDDKFKQYYENQMCHGNGGSALPQCTTSCGSMPCACCAGNHCDSHVNGCDGTGSTLTCQGVGTSSHNNETNSGSGTSGITTCTTSEIEAMNSCTEHFQANTPDFNNQSAICPWYHGMFGCFPACYCAMDGIHSNMIEVQSQLNSMNLPDTCTLTCNTTNNGGSALPQCTTSCGVMPCACCSGNHCDSDVNGCDGTGSALTCQGVGTPSHNNETNGGSNTGDGPRCDGPGWANHTCTAAPTTCQELTQMIGPGGCGHGCSTEFKEFAKKHLVQHKDCSSSDSGTTDSTTPSGTPSGTHDNGNTAPGSSCVDCPTGYAGDGNGGMAPSTGQPGGEWKNSPSPRSSDSPPATPASSCLDCPIGYAGDGNGGMAPSTRQPGDGWNNSPGMAPSTGQPGGGWNNSPSPRSSDSPPATPASSCLDCPIGYAGDGNGGMAPSTRQPGDGWNNSPSPRSSGSGTKGGKESGTTGGAGSGTKGGKEGTTTGLPGSGTKGGKEGTTTGVPGSGTKGTKGGKEGSTTGGTESGTKGDKESGTKGDKDGGTNDDTTTTTQKKVYVVKHKITISNMSPDSFNTNPDIKRAFGQAVSTLLNVDVSRVFNIRACLIGSTDAECPGEISADTSSPVETTNGGRLLLRILADSDSEVRYEIHSNSQNEMEAVALSVSGPTYQKENSFRDAFVSSMKTNNIDSKIANAVGAQPDTKSSQIVEDENGRPFDDSSNSITQNSGSGKDDDESSNTGMIMGVVAACVCMIAFGGFVFIVYTRTQKKTIGNHSRMVDDDSMVLEMTSNTNPMNNNMPVADAVIINETNQYYNKKGTDKGNWSSHQTPEGDTYFHDQVSGRTTWTDPNPSEESKTNNRPPQHVDRPSSL